MFGKGLFSIEGSKIEKELSDSRTEAQVKLEGEIEKTAEQIKDISLVNKMITKELQQIGLDEVNSILPDQVHIIESDLEDEYEMESTRGSYNLNDGNILINESMIEESSSEVLNERLWEEPHYFMAYDAADLYHEKYSGSSEEDEDKKWERFRVNYINETIPSEDELHKREKRFSFLHTLTHEAIHAVGFSKVRFDDEMKDYFFSRSGYEVTNNENDPWKAYLWGFNEAVVEKMTRDILEKNSDELETELEEAHKIRKAIDKYEVPASKSISDFIENKTSTYEGLCRMLNILIERLSEKTGSTDDDVWNDFKKHHFTGNIMHLRLIEKNLGAGTLRVLANADEDNFRDIIEFLEEEDGLKRNSLAEKILKEMPDESRKYRKRQ